jgi:hypothetical protein
MAWHVRAAPAALEGAARAACEEKEQKECMDAFV